MSLQTHGPAGMLSAARLSGALRRLLAKPATVSPELEEDVEGLDDDMGELMTGSLCQACTACDPHCLRVTSKLLY